MYIACKTWSSLFFLRSASWFLSSVRLQDKAVGSGRQYRYLFCLVFISSMVYIPKQQIVTRFKRYRALNETRLRRALALMSPEARYCLATVPVLLHYNHICLPGFRDHKVPHGIDLFTPTAFQKHYISSLITTDAPPLIEPEIHDILGLYAMGSTSSLGQSDSSDIDIWVCVRASLSPDRMQMLQDKCRFITNYVKAHGVELNLFVTPEDRFTNFQPDTLDEENCGSAQNLFLLDEFYRSSIRLCGRYIIWYMIATSEEQRSYQDYVYFLLHGTSSVPGIKSSTAPKSESKSTDRKMQFACGIAGPDGVASALMAHTIGNKMSKPEQDEDAASGLSAVEGAALVSGHDSDDANFSNDEGFLNISSWQNSIKDQSNVMTVPAAADAALSVSGGSDLSVTAETADGVELNDTGAGGTRATSEQKAGLEDERSERSDNPALGSRLFDAWYRLRQGSHLIKNFADSAHEIFKSEADNKTGATPAGRPVDELLSVREIAQELVGSRAFKHVMSRLIGSRTAASDITYSRAVTGKNDVTGMTEVSRDSAVSSIGDRILPVTSASAADDVMAGATGAADRGKTQSRSSSRLVTRYHVDLATHYLNALQSNDVTSRELFRRTRSDGIARLAAAMGVVQIPFVTGGALLSTAHEDEPGLDNINGRSAADSYYGLNQSLSGEYLEVSEALGMAGNQNRAMLSHDYALSDGALLDGDDAMRSHGNFDWTASKAATAARSAAVRSTGTKNCEQKMLGADDEYLLAAEEDGWCEGAAPLNAAEWFDFGSVVKSSPTEYFGSGLWLLYKAIDSPFKVVLKILLMEAYSSDYPDNRMLSSELKDYMLSHDGYSLDLDSYYLMYLKVSNYLQKMGHETRLTLMRKCFYLKIFMGLNQKQSHHSEDYCLKQGLLSKFTRRWGWSKEFVQDLENVSSWKMGAVRAFNQEVYNTLLESYQALLRFSVRHGIEYAITSDDAGILSRKLYAAFDRYPGKIPIMHTSFFRNLEERDLTFICPSEHSLCRKGWHLYTAAPDDVGLLTQKTAYIGSRLSETVTWACFNGLMTPRTRTYVAGSHVVVDSLKIRQLANDIMRVLGPSRGKVSEQSLQRSFQLKACVVVLNLEQDDTELLQNQLIDIEHGSTLCCGRQRICLVGSIDLVMVNSWGEISAISLPHGEEGVVELLATLLRIMSNSAEDQDNIFKLLNLIEVCSYAASYQDLIKYDLESTIRQVFNCLNRGNSSEYAFDVGRNTYIARALGERGVMINRKSVFGTSEFDISVLSRYGMRPEFALQVPPVVDRYATAGIMQYFFSPVTKGHWDIYIINERNEVSIYHNYYGSRAALVNAINRFYTGQSQSRPPQTARFNLPQYFVLSNDLKSLHPFTIKGGTEA